MQNTIDLMQQLQEEQYILSSRLRDLPSDDHPDIEAYRNQLGSDLHIAEEVLNEILRHY